MAAIPDEFRVRVYSAACEASSRHPWERGQHAEWTPPNDSIKISSSSSLSLIFRCCCFGGALTSNVESLRDATLADGENKGKFFDTTLGGEKFFTNGNNQSIEPAAARPVIVKVSGEARGSHVVHLSHSRAPLHVTAIHPTTPL